MGGGDVARGGLLERDAELDSIESAVKEAFAGDGSVVLIQGHAGVGKTLLVESAVESARSLGAQVLTARGVETEQEFAFGIVLQLLQRRVVAADESERTDILSGAAALARPLLEGRRLGGVQGPEAAFALSHGLYWVVSNLAEQRPLVLAIDDVHWADAASVRFLASLSNRLDGLAVAIVLTRRLGETPIALGALDAIAEVPSARLVNVGRLSDEAVGTIVRSRYDAAAADAFCAACARAVRGNPMYLRELLGELRAREIPADATGAEQIHDMSVDALSRSVRARLARAGPFATAIADAASIGDGGMPLRLLGLLAEVHDDEVDSAARALADADILEAGDPVRFVHPLVRNAVYRALGERRRVFLHRRAAEILRDEGAPAERIAGHLLETNAGSDDWAVEALLAAAGSAVERAAPESAVLHLRRALVEGGASWRARILPSLGLAAIANGEPDAIAMIREAADLAGTPSERVLYLLQASETLFVMRRFEEALAFGRSALAEIEGEEGETAAHAITFMAALSSVTMLSDRESVARLPRLWERMGATDTPSRTPLERLVPGVLAGIISLTGQSSAAEARRLATRATSSAPGEEIKGPMFQAPMALTYVDAFEEAEAVYAAAIEGARRFGLEYIFTMALGHRADTMYRSGSLRQAVADAGAAIEGGRGGWIELQARPLLTCSLLDMGDVDAARAAIQLRNVEQWSGATHIALFHEAVGRVRLAESRPTEALVAFREAGRIATESTALNPAFSAWRSGAAEAARALGALDEAKRLAAEEVELAKTFGAARAIGIALRVRGLVEGGSNGIDSLRESVDVLAASPARLEHARALTDLGAALRRSGAKSEARDHLRLGLDLAADCGATGLANRARSELVAAGGKPRRERISGIDSLTPQEHRIAELAAGGQSNREIAQALFLTRKTIETHLSNVYAKLGIRSRAELTAALHSDAG